MIETSDMEFDTRMVTAKETVEDREVEYSLRPQTLAEYIGQDKVKENMAIYIEAAKRRGDPLDHVLLYGPLDWERLRFLQSLRMRWGSTCVSLQVLLLKSLVIWLRF